MKITNYKSLGEILWKVMKNPLAAELTYEEAAEYAMEFITLLGAPVAYEDKLEYLELVMYKAELPCDIIMINGIRYLNPNGDGSSSADPRNGMNPSLTGIALRESTDIYQLDPLEFNTNGFENNDGTTDGIDGNYLKGQNYNEFTYTINKGILFSSIRSGMLQISYKGIVVDDDGFPMIPDNVKVMLGMEYYILSRYLEPIYLMGKISDKAFEYIQQKRYFYMPSAFTSLQMPSVDGLQSIMGSINRLIINTTAHSNFFKKMGAQEQFRRFL